MGLPDHLVREIEGRLNERHLRHVLQSHIDYYHRWRTHRSLDMDTPETRPVQPPEVGAIWKLHEVGGLHHHCERQAARMRGPEGP